MNGQDADQILMQGMVFHGHVGVLDSEKKNGQDFMVDVTFFCQRLAACQNDVLADTVDYGQAFRLVRQIVETARFDLVERLAEEIATRLLEANALADQVEVVVRKPQAPIQGRFEAMGVRIVRKRS